MVDGLKKMKKDLSQVACLVRACGTRHSGYEGVKC
jgi:hypothetical protein